MATPSTRGDALFVLDPLRLINPAGDSSYVMITEALRRGYRPYAVELAGLSLRHNEVYARATPVAWNILAPRTSTSRST